MTHHSSFMSHHSPPLHPYTPFGGQTLHCARALHGILRSGGQPSQFSTLVHPSTPPGGQTHIHTCLPVREAHLRALVWASRVVMLAFRLIFLRRCSFCPILNCAPKVGHDVQLLGRSSNTDTLARAVLFVLLEVLLADAACGAGPVFRDVLESGAGGYAGFRVTFCGIVDVAADYANILIHNLMSFGYASQFPYQKRSCCFKST